ncbi:PREDICTED: protein FAR1-RELATED SEQUENCE 5-like [Ipomoea nil]|uniref:protein FAR1-RELATED SEQUENCE 5-like n=1 Tax=Ipomoea nil TaxID=35883 RepID=UPI0009013C65|nr:PREDICTED: protein FAR1-RELATED SEQUENCE 5-like [Ipomoea nil]
MEIHGDATPTTGAAEHYPTGSIDGDSSTRDVTHYTPGPTTGLKQHWKPTVDTKIIPVLGQRFKSLSEGIEFYKNYGRVGGFDIRHNSVKRDRTGAVIRRSLVCSRQGAKGGGRRVPTVVVNVTSSSNKQRRRRVSNRIGCNAKLGLKKNSTGEFVVTKFVEDHTHSLCSEGAKLFMRGNRKLNVAQQAFLANCFKANVGASTGMRLCREVAGSFENVGATYVEFHNFKRDLQAYVDEVDGELIIERYNLVFVPFTGVDNHKRCITLAAGLLNKEDVESYSWLLERFIHAMGNVPLCVVTDQDPAMKIAIRQVLPGCRHRYCMWHIMTKVGEKFGPELSNNEVFRKSLNDIVWNETTSTGDFEVQWQLLMEKYNLSDHRWFQSLYADRDHWIPAFFIDSPLSGLVRTTSRSEAQNNVYGKFTRLHSSLVEFYMQFESVLETQRHNQAKLDAQCEGSLPDFKTPLALERHAADLFTLSIFYTLQEEIEAAFFYCEIVGIREDGGNIYYTIKGDGTTTYTVKHEPGGSSTICSCKMFQRLGLICRHMFMVFKGSHLQQLPSQYVVDRWRKHLGCNACRGQHVDGVPPKSGATELWSEINTCVGMVGESTVRQARMVQVLKELRDEFASDCEIIGAAKSNRATIEAFCGVQPPPCITIKPPAQAKNKGSGKRIKSNREIAIENSVKVGRKCGVCGEYARHNARSCPSKQRVV